MLCHARQFCSVTGSFPRIEFGGGGDAEGGRILLERAHQREMVFGCLLSETGIDLIYFGLTMVQRFRTRLWEPAAVLHIQL